MCVKVCEHTWVWDEKNLAAAPGWFPVVPKAASPPNENKSGYGSVVLYVYMRANALSWREGPFLHA